MKYYKSIFLWASSINSWIRIENMRMHEDFRRRDQTWRWPKKGGIFFLKWRCSMHKIKSKDTKGVWIVTLEREKLRTYDATSRRRTGELRASHFLASISAAPPRLWWPLRSRRVGKPQFQPVYIPYATRFVLGRLGFNLPVVATLSRVLLLPPFHHRQSRGGLRHGWLQGALRHAVLQLVH